MKVMKTVEGVEFLVDDDVYEEIKDYTWRVKKATGRIYRSVKKDVYLHKMLLPVEDGLFVDHVNGDYLDNRKENLRPATPSQNTANSMKREGSSSKYKGVYKETKRRHGYENTYWTASVKKDGKVVFRKAFKDEIEAAKAYDREALKAHGEYARLNFPDL